MRPVWRYASINANEITRRLTKIIFWGAKTVQTLIKRLADRGAPIYKKQGRAFVYTPLVKEDEYPDQESHSFLKWYYDGNLMATVPSFLEHDTLSEDDIAALRSLPSQGAGEGG